MIPPDGPEAPVPTAPVAQVRGSIRACKAGIRMRVWARRSRGIAITRKRRSRVSSRERPELRFRAFRYSGQVKRLVEHPGKAGNPHFARPRALERRNAGLAGRARSQNIVDQHDLRPLDRGGPTRIDRDRPAERPGPCPLAHPAEHGRRFAAHQPIDQQRSPALPRQLTRQQCRLVEPAPPQPPAMQRNGDEQPPVIDLQRQACQNQPRHQPRMSDMPPVLESQHQSARGIVVKRGG